MNLTDKILDHENLMRALHQIKNNKGKAGIDGMSVEELTCISLDMKKRSVLKSEKEDTVLFLLRGFILKSQTATTKRDRLESPSVVDRVIQQAVAQQLSEIYEPLFSKHSR